MIFAPKMVVTVMGLKPLFWSKNRSPMIMAGRQALIATSLPGLMVSYSPMIMAGKPLLQLPGLMVSYTQNLSIPYIYAGLSLTSWTS